jgi:hypothetical protein
MKLDEVLAPNDATVQVRKGTLWLYRALDALDWYRALDVEDGEMAARRALILAELAVRDLPAAPARIGYGSR